MGAFGDAHPRATVTEDQVRQIIQLLQSRKTQKEVARQFGVNRLVVDADANARYTVPALAVAATSPGYAAGYTYTDGTPYTVDTPPAQAAPCAATTAATSKAQADFAASPTAPSATTSAASAASATTTATTVATAAAAATTTTTTSGQLNSGTGVFFVEDVESGQAHVRDFFLTEQDWVAHCGVWRRRIQGRLSGGAARKRQQACGAQRGHGLASAFSHRHPLRV